MWRAHLSQNFVQPLQWPMKMNLNPAGGARDILAMVLSSPTLESKSGAKSDCVRLCSQPPEAQHRAQWRLNQGNKVALKTWENINYIKYRISFASTRHPKMSPNQCFSLGHNQMHEPIHVQALVMSETMANHFLLTREET